MSDISEAVEFPVVTIGQGVAVEPEGTMSCLLDCPFSRGGATEPACDRGPLIYGEVAGVTCSEPGKRALVVDRLGYVCTRGADSIFFDEEARASYTP
jgi:hypothetical protein